MGFKCNILSAILLMSFSIVTIAGGYDQTLTHHVDRCASMDAKSCEINNVDASFFVAKKTQYISLQVGVPYVNKIEKNSGKITGFQGVGAAAYLGMQFNHMFGPEIGFTYNGYNSLNSETHIVSAAIRGSIHFSPQITAFAKLGIGAGTVSVCSNACTKQTHLVPVFGGGLGYYLTRHWFTSVEFNGAYFENKPDIAARGTVGLLSFGITRFIDM